MTMTSTDGDVPKQRTRQRTLDGDDGSEEKSASLPKQGERYHDKISVNDARRPQKTESSLEEKSASLPKQGERYHDKISK